MAMQQDSTTPTTAPSLRRAVVFDRTTREYAMILDDEIIGYAQTHHQAEATLDALAYEILSTQADVQAPPLEDEALSASNYDLTDEQETELAEARQLAPTLIPTDAPITVGQLADGTPVLSGHTHHQHPGPLQVTTAEGYLLLSTRGLSGSWAGVDLHLNTAQLAALRALVQDGTLDQLLQLAAEWERRPRPRPWPAQTSRAA